MRRQYRRNCECADEQRGRGCGCDMVAAGMAPCRVRGFIVALVMIMRGAVVGRIRRRGVWMPVTAGGMSVGAGDHRRIGRHALERQGNQQYRNQQCA